MMTQECRQLTEQDFLNMIDTMLERAREDYFCKGYQACKEDMHAGESGS